MVRVMLYQTLTSKYEEKKLSVFVQETCVGTFKTKCRDIKRPGMNFLTL